MGSPTVPTAPNYSNFGQANNTFGSNLSGISGAASQGAGYTNNILNNQYAGGYQSAANQAGGLFGQLGSQASGASSALYGAGNQALGAGSSILNTAFDPQNALYARTQQQQQDQTNAQLASTGVGATPYGASVAAQNNSNFNIDWQNNELQRQIAGAGAYGQLNNTANQDFAGGASQGQGGADATLASGQLPYSTSNAINQANIGALGNQQALYGNATNASDQYLGLSNQGYQNQLAQYNAQNAQNQGMFGGIGSLLGDALGGFGSFGGLFGGGISQLTSLFGGGGVGNAFSGDGAASDGGGWQ
jgi:hypothetical protein